MPATNAFTNDRHTYINNLYQQVKGAEALAALNTGNQVTNFTSDLTVYTDPVVTRLSQMVGRTLMAVRPYRDKLRGIEVDSREYGWITRKENFIDDPVEENQTFKLIDGGSIDPWKINKPKVIETRSYGGGQISRSRTIYKNQLKGAFQSPAAMDEFFTGVMTHFNAQIAQDREQYKRTALINYMVCLSTYPARVIHLVSEYNAATGSSLTSTTVFAPANFEAFTQWLYGFIQKLVGLMGNRSYKYHLNPTTATPISGNIARQTSPENMRCFFNTGFKADMTARVVSNTFNRDDLRDVSWEAVDFWQNINSPTSVQATVKPMTTALVEAAAASVNLSNVFGVLMDRDALTVSYLDDYTGNTTYNQAGEYYNVWHNETVRITQDLTENGILLLLDTAT